MKAKRRCFTLLEVIVSMAVFALMMLGLMQFFTSAQQLWTSTSGRAAAGEGAKQALNMFTADLQNIYMEEPPDATVAGDFNKCFMYKKDDGLAFGTMRNEKADPDAVSRLTAVFYRKSGNVLETRVIADNKITNAEAWITDNVGSKTPVLKSVLEEAADNVTKTPPEYNSASTNWEVLASNVAHFKLNLLDRDMAAVTLNDSAWKEWKYPYLVQVTMVIIDEEAAKAFRKIKSDMNFKDLVDEKGKITTSDAAYEALLQGKVQVIQRAIVLERYITPPPAPPAGT